jgi:hypothetical protein
MASEKLEMWFLMPVIHKLNITGIKTHMTGAFAKTDPSMPAFQLYVLALRQRSTFECENIADETAFTGQQCALDV